MPVVDFDPLLIEYDERLLTPRPWTRMQSQWAAEVVDGAGDGPILELCSGAGHIGLEAARVSGRGLVCVDQNPVAAEFTERNAARAGLSDQVRTRTASVQEALDEGEVFAVAIADPPWVLSDAVGSFPEDPLLAIDGGPDGLVVARACVDACLGHLPPGGSLLVQLGNDEQADRLAAHAANDGWRDAGRRQGERGLVIRLMHP